MAIITIDNLSVTGSELFSDSESYLDQLSESDTLSIQGGISIIIITKTTTPTTSPFIRPTSVILPTPPVVLRS
ncbi:hypothetical protein [Nostoc sp.]|uniref:hypothetical protein n=1 Tax=Nostoc sp. TaxID=1180 RepID=UPI002FFA334B